jgi:hypothetical protein
MADRAWLPSSGSLEVNVCELFGSITVGAAGAVTTSSGKGIASVVKEASAGQYTITLSDQYNSLLWAGFTLVSSTDGAQTVGTAFRINSSAVGAAAPVVVLQCSDTATGADANLTSGDVVLFTFKLKNSSV